MKKFLLAAAAAALIGAPATAAVTVLTFEGLGNNAPVGNFYAPNYIFSASALALIAGNAGGSGNFSNEPSPSTVMYFLQLNEALLDVPAGFTGAFGFFYSSQTAATVTVFDGPGGTGNVLAVLKLVAQSETNCPSGSTPQFCNWTPVFVNVVGKAFSVDFTGTANLTAFDNITFGSERPAIPEPATWAMLIAGFGLVGLSARRRRVARAA